MTDYSRSNGVLSPSFEEAELFLQALAGKDTAYTFQTFDDVKNRHDKTLARIYQGTFNQHKAALAALNAKGAGVYVTVNQTDLKGRKEANIVKVRALFVDLDGSPIQPINDLPEDLQPHIIIESSPNKWHAYWLVNNCTLEQFKPLQQALAAKFDGDKAVCDLPRVMRLTGFSHNKTESFITRIHTMQDSLAPYSVNLLMLGLGLNNDKKPKSQAAIVAISAIDDDFTIGLPPEADVIADLKSALEYLSCEDYHDWIRQAMRLKTLGDTGLELFLSWSSKGSTFERVDAIHKWRGLHADRTGYKAIFNEAKANGWTNPLSSHKPPKTEKTDPIDPDLINKTIEALPTPEERNTARALQSAMKTIELQDFIGDSAITSSKIIGYGLSHLYKQAQGIGALLAMDWDKKTGGNSFSDYRGADLKHDRPITVASIYELAQSKGWVMPHELIELPDPLPIKQSLAPVMPFSADLLPHALREFVMDESDRMPCPPDFVAVSILTTLGSTIGASCGIKPKQKDDGWIIVPNQWGGIVAPPTSLKTPAMEAGIKPLNKLVEEAIKNHESELKTHKRDELAYQARVEGLHADLKSASKTTARKKAEHTANEFVDLIMEAEDNAPPPPVMRRYYTNDATIEKLGELERDNPNGILLMRDELMGWLAGLEKEGKQEDRAFYLEGFNGTGSKVVDRIMRGSTFIKNHCLSVLGGIQPDKLIAYFEQQISGLGNDGLLQRFQLLVYPDAMTWGYRDRYQNKDALNAILELFKKLSESDFLEFGAYPIDEYNKRPYFRFTLDAQAFFIEWLKKLNTEIIANEENTLIQQHLGKYARLMPSLALIFHLVDCVTHDTQGQVSLESAKQAAYWCEYLETHARRVYGLFDGMGMRPAVALSQKLKVCLNPTAKTDKTSEDWLKDGFVFRDIRRKQWQHLKDDISIKKALTVLLDNHWIYPVSVKSASNGGRPTTRYYISQKLKVCLNPTAKTDETQKTYNLGGEVGQKIGFVSFGSDLTGQIENLENNANDSFSHVDSVILANSDDAMEYEDGGID
jgi:hypothetical protein